MEDWLWVLGVIYLIGKKPNMRLRGKIAKQFQLAGCTTDDAAWECLSLPPGQIIRIETDFCSDSRWSNE